MTNYESNIKFIEKNYPEFKKSLDNFPDECIWFKENNNNCYIISDKNESILLFKEDPEKETAEFIKNIEFYEDEATILIGVGTGILFNKILNKKHKKHIIIVIEPELSLLKKMFSKHNLVKYFEKNNLCLITNNDEIHQVVSSIDASFVIQNWHILTEPYTIHKPSIYQMSIYLSNKTITQLLCNTGTICGAGKIIVENELRTLPYILMSPGINSLKGIFKNKPAVIVNTGPSLRKNIFWLKYYNDKIIIIAVAQALRILLSYEIRPDFICTVDYGEVNITHFNGLMDCDVPLIALNKTWYPILQQYQGPKFIAVSNSPGFENTAHGLLSERGSLDQGGSVSHFAFCSALQMECNPIMIIGQDLSLTESSHDPNADSMGKISIGQDGMIYWKVEDPNSPLLSESCMGPAVFSEGYYGDTVITNIGLDSFKTAFENMFKQHKDKTILNCTQGGVHIKDSKRCSLKFALDKYCNKNIDKDKIKNIIKDYECVNDESYYNDAIKIFDEDLKIIFRIKQNCNEALKWNKMLDECVNSKSWESKKIKNMLHQNKIFTNKAYKLVLTNPLIQTYIYNTSRLIQSKEVKGKGRINYLRKDKENRKLRVDRNKLILESVLKAADELEIHYNSSANKMKEYRATRNKELLHEKENYIPFVEDIEKYFSQGNWAHPFTIATKLKNEEIISRCRKMRDESINIEKELWKDDQSRIEYTELIQEAQKLGRHLHDFVEAEKLLLRAVKIFPDRFEARWGLASAYHMNKKKKKAIQLFEKLKNENHDNKQIQFEYGMVLLNYDTPKGIEYMEKFLNDTPDQYQNFWKDLAEICTKIPQPKYHEKSILFIEKYKEKYPFDTNI